MLIAALTALIAAASVTVLLFAIAGSGGRVAGGHVRQAQLDTFAYSVASVCPALVNGKLGVDEFLDRPLQLAGAPGWTITPIDTALAEITALTVVTANVVPDPVVTPWYDPAPWYSDYLTDAGRFVPDYEVQLGGLRAVLDIDQVERHDDRGIDARRRQFLPKVQEFGGGAGWVATGAGVDSVASGATFLGNVRCTVIAANDAGMQSRVSAYTRAFR